MTASLATVSYIGATILFILSLGGLSNPETSRRGNLFGMVGMALAVLATVFGPRVSPAGVAWTTWEAATSTLVFDQAMVDDYSDPDFALAFARIENHILFIINNLFQIAQTDLQHGAWGQQRQRSGSHRLPAQSRSSSAQTNAR